MNQSLYVFWKYDLCPYMLGAEVNKFWPNGKVEPRGYPGFAVEPLAIMPEDEGAKVLLNLCILQTEYREEEKKLRTRFEKMALATICK